jgi:hypothetical protein
MEFVSNAMKVSVYENGVSEKVCHPVSTSWANLGAKLIVREAKKILKQPNLNLKEAFSQKKLENLVAGVLSSLRDVELSLKAGLTSTRFKKFVTDNNQSWKKICRDHPMKAALVNILKDEDTNGFLQGAVSHLEPVIGDHWKRLRSRLNKKHKASEKGAIPEKSVEEEELDEENEEDGSLDHIEVHLPDEESYDKEPSDDEARQILPEAPSRTVRSHGDVAPADSNRLQRRPAAKPITQPPTKPTKRKTTSRRKGKEEQDQNASEGEDEEVAPKKKKQRTEKP